jgi:hypothetical protein
MATATSPNYEIRFQSLFNEGRALVFPCDAKGVVDLDRLSDTARNNYLYARAVVGREYGFPAVRQCLCREPATMGPMAAASRGIALFFDGLAVPA